MVGRRDSVSCGMIIPDWTDSLDGISEHGMNMYASGLRILSFHVNYISFISYQDSHKLYIIMLSRHMRVRFFFRSCFCCTSLRNEFNTSSVDSL